MNLLLESVAAAKLKQAIRYSRIQRGYRIETVSFTRVADGSAEDYLMAELEKQLTAGVADRVLGHLRIPIHQHQQGCDMCRSIKVLRSGDNQPSDQEVQEAALQFVRKISGYRHPSQANTVAFQVAVDEVAAASRSLLVSLKNRGQTRVEQK